MEPFFLYHMLLWLCAEYISFQINQYKCNCVGVLKHMYAKIYGIFCQLGSCKYIYYYYISLVFYLHASNIAYDVTFFNP